MFIRHAPCPKCKSKDNLAIYSDGEYCFGCHTAKKYTKEVKKDKVPTKFTGHLDVEIPYKYIKYLESFGLTERNIRSHFAYWSEADRLVFHCQAEYYEARSLTKEPKVLSFGVKPQYCFPNIPANGILVLVEDIISALKVSNVYASGSLFGSSLSSDWMRLIEKYKCKPIFWLDKDKLKASKEYRDKFRAKGIESSIIFTPKDPKYYYKYEISEYVKKASRDFTTLPTKVSSPLNPVDEEPPLGLAPTVMRWNPEISKMQAVPLGSYRATVWSESIPNYIPDESLNPGFAWRYANGSMQPILRGTTLSRTLPCNPPNESPQATRWNSNIMKAELIQVEASNIQQMINLQQNSSLGDSIQFWNSPAVYTTTWETVVGGTPYHPQSILGSITGDTTNTGLNPTTNENP
jgi:hypothetical protein